MPGRHRSQRAAAAVHYNRARALLARIVQRVIDAVLTDAIRREGPPLNRKNH